MFDEDESELKRKSSMPLSLESLSAGELDTYHHMLQEEIQRVEVERERKQLLRKSADNFFKRSCSISGG